MASRTAMSAQGAVVCGQATVLSVFLVDLAPCGRPGTTGLLSGGSGPAPALQGARVHTAKRVIPIGAYCCWLLCLEVPFRVDDGSWCPSHAHLGVRVHQLHFAQ